MPRVELVCARVGVCLKAEERDKGKSERERTKMLCVCVCTWVYVCLLSLSLLCGIARGQSGLRWWNCSGDRGRCGWWERMKSLWHVQHNTKHQSSSTKEEAVSVLSTSDLIISAQFSLTGLLTYSPITHTISQWALEAMTSNFMIQSKTFAHKDKKVISRKIMKSHTANFNGKVKGSIQKGNICNTGEEMGRQCSKKYSTSQYTTTIFNT